MPGKWADHAEMPLVKRRDDVSAELTSEHDVHSIRQPNRWIVVKHGMRDEEKRADRGNFPASRRHSSGDVSKGRFGRTRSLAAGDKVIEFSEDARRDHKVADLRETFSNRLMVLVGVIEKSDQRRRVGDDYRKLLSHLQILLAGHLPVRRSR